MIYLKIENNVGKFYKDGTYETIDKMANDDLWRLANAVMKDDDFQMNVYDEALLPNKAHRIIYSMYMNCSLLYKNVKSSIKMKVS